MRFARNRSRVRGRYSREMRIVVSGTHASGKSTLISDFVLRHPDFTVLPDPFELIDETWDAPGAAMFARQLRISADRLARGENTRNFIAERGPLDFLAYLLALDEWTGAGVSRELLDSSAAITADALRDVDFLVILPLSASQPIDVGAEEFPELRLAMNDELLDLIDDTDLIGPGVHVVEITGDRQQRVAQLESLLSAADD